MCIKEIGFVSCLECGENVAMAAGLQRNTKCTPRRLGEPCCNRVERLTQAAYMHQCDNCWDQQYLPPTRTAYIYPAWLHTIKLLRPAWRFERPTHVVDPRNDGWAGDATEAEIAFALLRMHFPLEFRSGENVMEYGQGSPCGMQHDLASWMPKPGWPMMLTNELAVPGTESFTSRDLDAALALIQLSGGSPNPAQTVANAHQQPVGQATPNVRQFSFEQMARMAGGPQQALPGYGMTLLPPELPINYWRGFGESWPPPSLEQQARSTTFGPPDLQPPSPAFAQPLASSVAGQHPSIVQGGPQIHIDDSQRVSDDGGWHWDPFSGTWQPTPDWIQGLPLGNSSQQPR